MNAYLSREEKENFIRATALAAQLENTIDSYTKSKSIDPEFLKYLRTGRTWVAKAMTMRSDALSDDARVEFAKQVSRMELLFVPTLEAKKVHAELMALKTTLPMELQDFEDWYESVIETTCKRCLREDYADCKTRRVLAKYGVYPIDPGAVGKCQYSYVGTPEQEELQPSDAEIVPAAMYNLALAQLAELNDALDDWHKKHAALEIELNAKEEAWVCNDCVKAQQTPGDTALQARLKTSEEEYPVSIAFVSGGETEYSLPASMAKNMIREFQKPRHTRPVCAQYVSEIGRLMAIDLQEVAYLQVDKLPPGDWIRERTDTKSGAATPAERERYRIECKCGAEYFVSLGHIRNRAFCRECKGVVFADRQADKVPDPLDGVEATLLTNRYWVQREPYQEVAAENMVDLKGSGKKYGRDYKDPCDPLAG